MERLEVEDDEQRQRRIQTRLENLNTSSRNTRLTNPPLTFDFGDRTTYPVAPPTELLARVQAFLPQIEESNALLAQQVEANPASVNIEHLGEDMERYIEMNLGLGVFEDRSAHKSKSQHNSSFHNPTQGVETPSSSSSSEGSSADEEHAYTYDSDCSDADTDSSSEIITSFSRAPRLIRPIPRRSPASRLNGNGNDSPKICVLSENETEKQRPPYTQT